MQIQMWIQLAKIMRIHLDPDLQRHTVTDPQLPDSKVLDIDPCGEKSFSPGDWLARPGQTGGSQSEAR
jgi:hypothetical protein